MNAILSNSMSMCEKHCNNACWWVDEGTEGDSLLTVYLVVLP